MRALAAAALALALAACPSHVPPPQPPTTDQPRPPSPEEDRAQLVAAMASYDKLTLALDADGLAGLFAPEGQLVNNDHVVATGRETIRHFLGSFAGKVEVRAAATTVEDVQITGDRAHVSGTFEQTAHLVEQDQDIHATGKFDADWVRTPDGWQIARMHTTPDPQT